MQISAVRDALANAARTITLPAGIAKLTATGFMPDAVVTPHFFVADIEITYDRVMGRGLDELLCTCRVLVSRSDDRSAQRILDAMLSGSGAASLKAALEAARGAPGQFALGGLADDLHLQRVQGYRWFEHADTTYLGAELTVKVIGSGST